MNIMIKNSLEKLIRLIKIYELFILILIFLELLKKYLIVCKLYFFYKIQKIKMFDIGKSIVVVGLKIICIGVVLQLFFLFQLF